MTGEIISRDEELAFLQASLNQTFEGPVARLIEGEAGIGQSTLWLAGVEAAHERGLRVLLSRPAEAEQDLAHAGLGDVFEMVLESVLPALGSRSTMVRITSDLRGKEMPEDQAWTMKGRVIRRRGRRPERLAGPFPRQGSTPRLWLSVPQCYLNNVF